MRLNAFILALCVCLYQVRSASIKAPEKKLDDLDNVDLDVAEPDLIDQPSVVDIDNNVRKNIIDIPVKVIQESNMKVLDENSNNYVPNNDDSINIKLLEIDISDPVLQQQEHETQNPENYDAKENVIFDIKRSIIDTQNIFNTGLKRVSISLKTVFADNEDLPAIKRNIQNLRQTFERQIEKLNVTIRSHFKEKIKPSKGAAIDPALEIVNSGLRNLKNNFRSGVNTLTDGVEVLSILQEEGEAARAEGTLRQAATPDTSAPQPAPIPAVQNPSQITQPVMSFINVFQQGIVTSLDNLNFFVQTFLGNPQGSNPQIHISNPIVNFIQGITGSNNGQAQNPSNQATASEAPAAGAQNDAAALVPAPAATPAPWSIGAAFQQVQNSFQNLISPQQNQQQSQPQAINGPISQAFQNIVQFIRPGQGNAQQPVPQPAISVPAKAPEAAVPETSNDVSANPVPAPAVATLVQAQLVQAPQSEPILQLVQYNPIIKGIQSAVQRIQNPNADTPRNEEVKKNIVDNDVNPKGTHGGNNNNNNFNQGAIESSGRVGMLPEAVEILNEDIPVKSDNEIAEKIVAEEIQTP